MKTDYCYHRDETVTEGVFEHDPGSAQSLGLGRSDIVLAQDLQHGGSSHLPEAAFALAELAFNWNPVKFILALLEFSVQHVLRVLGGFLRRTPQWWPGHPDTPLFLAVSTVVTCSINSTAMHRFRIAAKALFVSLDLFNQITGLVKRIPVKTIQEHETINQTG